jgi:hypothetical protein
MSNAAEGGHLKVLQLAREHHCPWDATTCNTAARDWHLAMERERRFRVYETAKGFLPGHCNNSRRPRRTTSCDLDEWKPRAPVCEVHRHAAWQRCRNSGMEHVQGSSTDGGTFNAKLVDVYVCPCMWAVSWRSMSARGIWDGVEHMCLYEEFQAELSVNFRSD